MMTVHLHERQTTEITPQILLLMLCTVREHLITVDLRFSHVTQMSKNCGVPIDSCCPQLRQATENGIDERHSCTGCIRLNECNET